MVKRVVALCSVMSMTLLVGFASAGHAGTVGANAYQVHNLVSDQMGVADHQDPNLVNAWGLAAGPMTPWWVANNHSNTATIYDGTGAANPLVVGVNDAPTGEVFNGGTGFKVHHAGFSGPSVFLFATEGRHDPRLEPERPAADALDALVQGRELRAPGRRVQGPRDRVDPPRGHALRDRLPQRPRRRVRRALPPDPAAPLRRQEPAGQLRAVRHPDDRQGGLRHLREAGPELGRRAPRGALRVRRHVQPPWTSPRSRREPARAQRAVGPRVGAGHLRPLQR